MLGEAPSSSREARREKRERGSKRERFEEVHKERLAERRSRNCPKQRLATIQQRYVKLAGLITSSAVLFALEERKSKKIIAYLRTPFRWVFQHSSCASCTCVNCTGVQVCVSYTMCNTHGTRLWKFDWCPSILLSLETLANFRKLYKSSSLLFISPNAFQCFPMCSSVLQCAH